MHDYNEILSTDKKDLKMSLKSLRSKINVYKKKWIHNFTTNCYAYALGLDIPENHIKRFAYSPGGISGSKECLKTEKIYSFSTLIENLHSDLDCLGIEFKEIKPTEKVADDEWKIALFTSSLEFYNYSEFIYGFHFLRQSKQGNWYHKRGWFRTPTNKDSNLDVITDPSECYLKGYDYEKCYSLKLK